MFTVLEEHVGLENRSLVTGKKEDIRAADFFDSIGVGYYRIDLHPSCAGTNYIDIDSLPFQIPLGALIPVRMKILLLQIRISEQPISQMAVTGSIP